MAPLEFGPDELQVEPVRIPKVVMPGHPGPIEPVVRPTVQPGPGPEPARVEWQPLGPEGWGQPLLDAVESVLAMIRPGLDRYPLRADWGSDTVLTWLDYVGSVAPVRDWYGVLGSSWGNWPGWTYYHIGQNLLDDLSYWLPMVRTEPSERVRSYWQVSLSERTAQRLARIRQQLDRKIVPVAECVVRGLLLGYPDDPTVVRTWLQNRARQLRRLYRVLQVLYQLRVARYDRLFRVRRQLWRSETRRQAELELYQLQGQLISKLLRQLRSSLDFLPREFECLPLQEWEQQLRETLTELVRPYLHRQQTFDQVFQFQALIDDQALTELDRGRTLLVWLQRVRQLAEYLEQLVLSGIRVQLRWPDQAKAALESGSDPLEEPLRPGPSGIEIHGFLRLA